MRQWPWKDVIPTFREGCAVRTAAPEKPLFFLNRILMIALVDGLINWRLPSICLPPEKKTS